MKYANLIKAGMILIASIALSSCNSAGSIEQKPDQTTNNNQIVDNPDLGVGAKPPETNPSAPSTNNKSPNGTTNNSGNETAPTTTPPTTPAPTTPAPSAGTARKAWNEISSYVHINCGLNWSGSSDNAQMAQLGTDLLVTGGFETRAWTKSAVDNVKRNKHLLGYIAVGETAQYMASFQAWKGQIPDYVLAENPNWPGNFYVKYWDPRWQEVIYRELDNLLALGADGTFLDVVDVYWNEGFPGGPYGGPNGEPNGNMRLAVEWVKKISQYAKSRNPNFKIVVNNAADLVDWAGYKEAVDGVVLEGLYWSVGGEQRSNDYSTWINTQGQKWVRSQKKVMTIEYADLGTAQSAISKGRQLGYIPFVDVKRGSLCSLPAAGSY